MAKIQRVNGEDLAGKLLTALQFGDIGTAARAVADAAIHLMDACASGKYRTALEQNLELWVALRTVADTGSISQPDLAEQIKRLAAFVIANTEAIGDAGLADKTLTTFITIDLQIASGLVEAASEALIRQRAHEIWEAEGRPDGREKDHWNRAQQELQPT
jgi:hypothetical protein